MGYRRAITLLAHLILKSTSSISLGKIRKNYKYSFLLNTRFKESTILVQPLQNLPCTQKEESYCYKALFQ